MSLTVALAPSESEKRRPGNNGLFPLGTGSCSDLGPEGQGATVTFPPPPPRQFNDDDASRLGTDGFVVLDGWLGSHRALALALELQSLLDRGCFAASRVGQGAQRQQAAAIRSDKVCWFDVDAAPEVVDGRTGVRPGVEVDLLLGRLRALLCALNSSCFLALTDIECHAACYETGSGYDAHIDAFVGGSRRVISFVLYLNEGWTAADGGCLRMHGAEGESAFDIEPLFDRLVIFQSRKMLHEVRPVSRRRWSATGWLSTR